MTNLLRRQTVTLVIRLWAEYLEQVPPALRGEIEEVGSGKKIYFCERGEILNFITQATFRGIETRNAFQKHREFEENQNFEEGDLNE